MRVPVKTIVLVLGVTLTIPPATNGQLVKKPVHTSTTETSKVRRISFAQTTFDVFTASYPKDQIKFYWKDPKGNKLQSLDNLKAHVESDGQQLIFATNAGMYLPDNSPMGLYVERSNQIIPVDKKTNNNGNFYLQPNGIFLLTKTYAKVIPTGEYDHYKAKMIFATQSGPLLLINGKINSKFTKGSANAYIRSGVGIDSLGRAVFAISNAPVNFYDFAALFKEVLKCNNALYLDGAISRMYLPALQRNETGGSFGAMIGVVTPK